MESAASTGSRCVVGTHHGLEGCPAQFSAWTESAFLPDPGPTGGNPPVALACVDPRGAGQRSAPGSAPSTVPAAATAVSPRPRWTCTLPPRRTGSPRRRWRTGGWESSGAPAPPGGAPVPVPLVNRRSGSLEPATASIRSLLGHGFWRDTAGEGGHFLPKADATPRCAAILARRWALLRPNLAAANTS